MEELDQPFAVPAPPICTPALIASLGEKRCTFFLCVRVCGTVARFSLVFTLGPSQWLRDTWDTIETPTAKARQHVSQEPVFGVSSGTEAACSLTNV